jgi:hypothetical protein
MDNPVKPHYRLGINTSEMLHEKAYLSIHLKHLNIFYYKTQISNTYSYLIIDITDHLHISNKTLQLLFFSGFSSSYFPLMQTKVSISCKVQQKLQIFFPCSTILYNLNVVTNCECFICNTKFSSDILQGSNSYKFDDNHTQNLCSFHCS